MKSGTIKELKAEFEGITLLRIFEIEVTDNRNSGSNDFIIFNIFINKNTLIAQHEPLNEKQAKSKKIAFQKVVLDSDYSLNSHLEALSNECECAIIESEYFNLAN